MSETTCAFPDVAIEAVRERIRQLDGEIAERARLNDTAKAVRDELTDLIATLTRKAKPRKQRVSGAAGTPATDTEEPALRSAVTTPGTFPPGTFGPPRPSVFAIPANDAGDVAEAA